MDQIMQDETKENLKQCVNSCQSFISTLNDKIFENKEILEWFQKFCHHLTLIIAGTGKVNRDLNGKLEKGQKDSLLLYLTQLLTALSLLINLFVREINIGEVLREARKCVLRQIMWCLGGIKDVLTKEEIIIDPSGSFIRWMDASLDKVSEIDSNNKHNLKTCNNAKELIEEVLSHAMSIAQVALMDDCKIIKSASKSVLDSIESLAKEISKNSPNTTMVNLLVEVCTDKLISLERKVNTAVLKLSLKVFSEFTIPLGMIEEYCLNKNHKGKVDAMDSLVADFDLHVDRIMQIGLFAVSCSTCVNRGIKIRSCLASLEAMEAELVPAFTAVILDYSKPNIHYSKLLRCHWVKQARLLQQLIYHIIDPFAFCKIIYEECKHHVESMSQGIKKDRKVLTQNAVQILLDKANVLDDFMIVVIKEESGINLKVVEDSFADFKKMKEEVNAAASVLLKNNNTDIENSNRVLKRCKILLTTIKNLSCCFVDSVNEKENVVTPERHGTSNSSNNDHDVLRNRFLDHVIKRGKQILQDRSVLYRSSIRNHHNLSNPASLKQIKLFNGSMKTVPLGKANNLRNFSFASSRMKNETSLDLQITDILNELTSMSTTFTSTKPFKD